MARMREEKAMQTGLANLVFTTGLTNPVWVLGSDSKYWISSVCTYFFSLFVDFIV